MTPELNSAISKAAEEYADSIVGESSKLSVAEKHEWTDVEQAYTAGATEALTNPDLYEKAGLGKREESLEFPGYIPFGEEWKKEVKKLSKDILIEQWKSSLMKIEELTNQNSTP